MHTCKSYHLLRTNANPTIEERDKIANSKQRSKQIVQD